MRCQWMSTQGKQEQSLYVPYVLSSMNLCLAQKKTSQHVCQFLGTNSCFIPYMDVGLPCCFSCFLIFLGELWRHICLYVLHDARWRWKRIAALEFVADQDKDGKTREEGRC